MKRLLPFALLLAGSMTYAQTSNHQVTLTISDADTSATNPGTAQLYRASGSCPATGVPTSGITTLTTALAVPGSGTYVDQNVTAGSTYCYFGTVKLGGATSPNSNTFQSTITLLAPTLTGTAQ